MNSWLIGTLTAMALLDGAFSGFRASVGRTGLVRHRRADLVANVRGAGLMLVLLLPALAVFTVDLWRAGDVDGYARGATALARVVGPYAAIVLVALAAYFTLGWRQKYLATALILGPFKLARPAVILVGIVLAVAAVASVGAALVGVLVAAAVLSVEPLAGYIWWREYKPLRR